jgi:serine protease Do
MHDGTERTATYIAGDTISDLAILKLDNTSNIEPAVFGDSREIFCGENVVAVGRPSDATADSSITSGIISLTKRRIQTTSNYSARLIQTDSAINPGSSGGALVNMYGQVIGITASKLAGVEYDAIGFAIPTTTVKRVCEQLITHGKVTNRAKLGITYNEINSVTAEIRKLENVGLYIVSVGEDSDLYGKVVEGDMITHINGIEITNDDIVLDLLEECVAGDQITLSVVNSRGGVQDYTVTLKANIGESSYKDALGSVTPDGDSSGNPSGPTFDFPFGE